MTNLDRWRLYLRDVESSDIYIDWTFYTMVSAALQRRVCLNQIPHLASGRPIFPNIYVIFIGPPGIGKSSAAFWAVELFKTFGGFDSLTSHSKRIIKIAPSSLTVEQLYRYMNTNYALFELPKDLQTSKDSSGSIIKHYLSSPLAFFATEELGSLFRENTSDLVKFVTEGWDCGDFHRETKTQGVDFIKSMCTTMLGCGTPDWIAEVSKNGLLQQGFTARTIFVWSEKKRHLKAMWDFEADDQQAAWKELQVHVKKLTQLYGPVRLAPDAKEWLDRWYEDGGETNRLNPDKRLLDYYTRKKVHLIKTAMVVHYAERYDSTITIADFLEALRLLDRTELDMHKALLGTAFENPAAKVAAKLEDKLINGSRKVDGTFDVVHWVPESKLLLHVYDDCINGRATFDEAVKYLSDTGRIDIGTQNGKPAYKLKRQ